ncbi:MAG TPA: hypothetical protein PKC43_01195 [Phycisphaerales bacterium]|nr:hypothetical protein [Phycisphaerales bacterium]HMP36041.1 hypothetical protein [Phycisphaerales bacterium]
MSIPPSRNWFESAVVPFDPQRGSRAIPRSGRARRLRSGSGGAAALIAVAAAVLVLCEAAPSDTAAPPKSAAGATEAPPAAQASPGTSAPAARSAPPRRRSLDELLETGPGAGPSGESRPETPPRGGDDRSTIEDAPPRPSDAGGDPADVAAERRRDELRRALEERQIGDAFTQAIDAMAQSASLLDVRLDTSIGTQRLQEEIVAKLDFLLNQPPRRSRGSSSSSSSSQQQSSQQNVPNNPSSSASSPSEQREASQQASSTADGIGGPPLAEATLEELLEGAGADWGNLPARVRDLVRQGLRERPSGLYRRMTEDYYRRLAEESAR